MRGSGSQARLIEDFLKREYGVKGVAIEHLAKHARICWEYQGSAHSLIVSRNTTAWRVSRPAGTPRLTSAG